MRSQLERILDPAKVFLTQSLTSRRNAGISAGRGMKYEGNPSSQHIFVGIGLHRSRAGEKEGKPIG